MPRFNAAQKLSLAAVAVLGIGIAGGAGAVSLTRPAIEMAPTVPTAITRLPSSSGVVTVKGRVAAIYGDRMVVQDGTGRALVDVGRRGQGAVGIGSPVIVQGRFDQGQLRARFLVDRTGTVTEVGAPPPPPPRHGPGAPPPPLGANGAGPNGVGPNGAGPNGAGAPPPPPPGGPLGAPQAGGPGTAPPPPAGQAGALPPPPPPVAAGAPAAPGTMRPPVAAPGDPRAPAPVRN